MAGSRQVGGDVPVLKHPKTFRLAPQLVERLEAFARRKRRSRTAVVEAALDQYLAAAEEGVAVVPPAALSSAAEPEVDLAGWLAARTDIPRALCAKRIEARRVTVDGKVVSGPTVSVIPLGGVRLDGEVVGP